ncbi:hypothetical protein PsYK624_105400 [Phanerochaete sordida]|uniref:F-box domain-containing protein n=1 Tax=Phanerochaete sordida TaxID=48140 RepID=A0A9P3GG79_9APHY|nr:hypothetical protein PsYK624_105400 [Phanerochaete sordida]
MDILWAVLPSLSFLMGTLPRDAWSATLPWYHEFTLLRPLDDEEDWALFVANAKRVKHLSMHDEKRGLDTSGLQHQLEAIALQLQRHPILFPSLRSVHISSDVSPVTAVLLGAVFFCSPHLEEYWMATCKCMPIASVLHGLASWRPNIRFIEVHTWPSVPSQIIARFTHLEKLCVSSPLSEEDIFHLSGLHTLLALQISFPHSYRLCDAVQSADAFASLTKLSLYGIRDVTQASSFLAMITLPRLGHLELAFNMSEVIMEPQCSDLLHAIALHVSLEILQLRVYRHNQDDDDEEDEEVDGSISIRPLFNLRKLKILMIDTELLRDAFTDATIAELGRAWPDLDCLDYSPSIRPILSGPLTLDVLAQCAAHFPKLTRLALDVDALLVPAPPPAPLAQQMIEVELTGSLIDQENCAEVAAYIAAVFPQGFVRVNNYPDTSHETLFWTHVKGMLPVLRRMRKELGEQVDHEVEMSK